MATYTLGVTQVSNPIDVAPGTIVSLSATSGVTVSYIHQYGPPGSASISPTDFPLKFNEPMTLTFTTSGTALTVTTDENPSQATQGLYIPDYTHTWNPAEYYIRQHADRAAFTSNTTQQALFDATAAGAVTLPIGAYFFDIVAQLKSMSATSGNIKFSLLGGGTATLAGILYTAQGIDAANDTTTAFSGVAEIISTQTATDLATASTATVLTFMARGSFEVTAAGTVIPSAALTTAATAVVTAGSYCRIRTLSNTTTAVSYGPWS